MVEKINNLIEKFGLSQSIKMLGGFHKFKEIVDNNPQLNHHLNNLKGSCSVSLVNTPDAYFDFYIMDYDIMDGEFVELIVDMIVNFNNLSGEEIYQLKQWFGAVADDHGFEIYDIDLKIPTHQNLFIKSFNGRPYTFEGYEDFISDEEAIELLDKTGLWEGMIREEKSLRYIIKNILKEESDEKENRKESFNQKIRDTIDNLGFVRAYEMFGNNKEIIKNAYKDNPLAFLNQYNNLNPDEKYSKVMFYRDENGKPLFVNYKEDAYLSKSLVNIDNDRIWAFFGEVLGYDYDEIQSLLKVWLSEVYGLDNVTPLRAYQISEN
jgi:hypothetical protein